MASTILKWYFKWFRIVFGHIIPFGNLTWTFKHCLYTGNGVSNHLAKFHTDLMQLKSAISAASLCILSHMLALTNLSLESSSQKSCEHWSNFDPDLGLASANFNHLSDGSMFTRWFYPILENWSIFNHLPCLNLSILGFHTDRQFYPADVRQVKSHPKITSCRISPPSNTPTHLPLFSLVAYL